jgi:hypothetical protein
MMSSQPTTTPFFSRAEILGNLWMSYRNDEEFKDFMEYNDLGLPLAYAISMNIVDTSGMAEKFVNEAWELFLTALGIEDTGFETLEDVLGG